MKCVVTGTAGSIGSFLCEHLLAAGHAVTGVDAFTPCYSPDLKRRTLAEALQRPGYRFRPTDLRGDEHSGPRMESACYRRLIRVWRRLPISVTRWIGPASACGIPSVLLGYPGSGDLSVGRLTFAFTSH